MPGFVRPQLARSGDKPPRGGEWLHEIKIDGYRLQLHIDRGDVRAFTRRGKDWTERFPELARAASGLPVDSAVIDGEVSVIAMGGVPSFAALQQRLSGERPGRLAYYAFDLLHLNGRDLRDCALADRKSALRQLLDAAGNPEPFLFSRHFEAEGARVFDHACRFALEGIVSKKRDAPYRSGRQRTWRKTKCVARQEFVIAGYSKPSTGREGIGSLVLACHDADGRLVYAGRVGTGFGEQESADLRRALDNRRMAACPLDDSPVPLPKGLVWARPDLVCEIEFRSWTEDGLVRQGAYKGLREDKPPEEVGPEAPGHGSAGKGAGSGSGSGSGSGKESPAVAGVTLSHPDRLLFPQTGLTKLGLAQYWQIVAEAALPDIAGRPLSLVRCPSGIDGDCFFQKHAMAGLGDAVRRLPIREAEGKRDYLAVDGLAGLIQLVQLGTIELHGWGARAGDIERPDRLVFDLDPGEGVAWAAITAAADELHDRLDGLGLDSLCSTTGGKGLHVLVPLRPRHGWDAVKAFCRALAEAMAADSPKRYVTTAGKARRKGRIYIDYLRNARGATAILPYSPRARPGAPVAAPIGWEDLPFLQSAGQYSVDSMRRRIAGPGPAGTESGPSRPNDPWAEIHGRDQALEPQAFRAVGLDPDAFG
jgi:bifunctional non-homologous end joining protein LigD